MRKLLFGLFGFVALGFGALSAQPAEAHPSRPGYRHYERPVVHYTRPVVIRHVEYRRPYRFRRPHGYYRPIFAGPRCFIRTERVWTHYGWTRRPVRICRY